MAWAIYHVYGSIQLHAAVHCAVPENGWRGRRIAV
jgi:hypothetical protein